MNHDRNDNLDAVRIDDEFLTALSRGEDPSQGEDELAALFLDMQREVDAPMPSVPVSVAAYADQEAADTQQGAGNVGSLGKHRKARRRRGGGSRTPKRPHPLVSGLIGAAAATLLIAGAGGVALNVIGQQPRSEVELASDLEELEKLSADGDSEAVQKRVAKLRERLQEKSTVTETEDPEKETVVRTKIHKAESDGRSGAGAADDPATVTETVHEKSEPAPHTVTETVVVTETRGMENELDHEGEYVSENTEPEPAEDPSLEELAGDSEPEAN